MVLKSFLREMSRSYVIVSEREQDLRFRKLEPDRWLPSPVDFGQYRIIFTERVRNGFLANVFSDGRLLGTTKVTRFIERGVEGPGENEEILLKLNIADIGVMRMTQIKRDPPKE